MNEYNNNGNKQPTQKSQIIVIVLVLAAFAVIFYGASTQSFGLAMGGFFAAFITVFVVAMIQGKNKIGAIGGSKNKRVNASQFQKYLPLLSDERTKQHPDVQRLLQYTEVQRVFFDPSTLSNSQTADDEHVRELFLVFDEILAQGVIYGSNYNYGNNGNYGNNTPQSGYIAPQSGYAPMQTAKPQNPQAPQTPDNKPRRKIGLILQLVGLSLFFLPFILAFVMAISGDKASGLMAILSFVFTAAAPFGMMLMVVGIIMKRK